MTGIVDFTIEYLLIECNSFPNKKLKYYRNRQKYIYVCISSVKTHVTHKL